MYPYMFAGNKCDLESGENLHILLAKCELIPVNYMKIFGVQPNYICIWHVVWTFFFDSEKLVHQPVLHHCLNSYIASVGDPAQE